jgi:HK97 family phage prohead protease
MQRREFGFREIKLADGDSKTGIFSGYGAVFGNEDSYGDVIERGAFAESLDEWKGRGKLPPMLLQHGGGIFAGGADDMLPIGKWTSMREDSKGLKVEGQLFALDTERGKYIYEGLKEGVLDGLSIGFRVREARNGTRAGEPDRTITNIDLWEVSIVTFPANPKARVSSVKTFTPDQWRDLETSLCDAGASRRLSKFAIARFKELLGQRDADLSDSVLREAVTPTDSADAEALKAADELLSRFLIGSLTV